MEVKMNMKKVELILRLIIGVVGVLWDTLKGKPEKKDSE